MSGKNWSNLYFEVLKANDELLGREWGAIKGNKEAATKLIDGIKGANWKKYIDAMAGLRDSAVKVDSSISNKAESLYGKIEEKWKSINDLVTK